MVGPTAQIVALTCAFNARARGLPPTPFFPANSTATFCEYIHFVRRHRNFLGPTDTWQTEFATPDDWLAHAAQPGCAACLVHEQRSDPNISDRMSAGFIGGGGQWQIAIFRSNAADIYQSRWEVGNREAADRRIWHVDYGLLAEHAAIPRPSDRPIAVLRAALLETLPAISAFATEQKMNSFAILFDRARDCLSSSAPFETVFHKDLAPAGLLELPAQQLLAACQAAWVFGGMGSWNDTGFDGDARYDQLSGDLFRLLNESICAAVNSATMV